MKSLLKTLTETFAPSGYEDAVRKIIQKEVKPYADEIRVDAMGSFQIVRKKPTAAVKNSKRIMLAAHMDEIGVIVSHVDKNGYVRFASNGGVFGRYTLGARIRFMNGVTGVVGFDKLESVDQAPSLSKMYIDVGATSRSNCPVKVGDFGAFERSYMEMGNRLVAKSMDDRAGVVVLIETLKSIKATPHDLYFVFTTQEEVGTRGAGTAAFSIDPEIGIAIDVTGTGDARFVENVHGVGQGSVCKGPRPWHARRPACGRVDGKHCRKSKTPLPA